MWSGTIFWQLLKIFRRLVGWYLGCCAAQWGHRNFIHYFQQKIVPNQTGPPCSIFTIRNIHVAERSLISHYKSLTAATGTRISTNSPATECLTSLSLTSRKNCAHSCINWKECSKSSKGTIFTRKNFIPMRSEIIDCVVCVDGSRILSVL